ncbi:MAG: hypothetical protein ACRC41_04195 [Sarcina sp.]
MIEESGKLVLVVNNELGLPVYNSKIDIESKLIKRVIKTNFCGLASCDLPFGEYILKIAANEYNSRKFKVFLKEKNSFLAITLKYLDNSIHGYIKDDENINNQSIKVYLLYEITDGTFVRVKETFANKIGYYKFENIPRGNYKVEAVYEDE